MAASLKDELEELRVRYALLEKEANSLKQENIQLKNSTTTNNSNTLQHTREFWVDIDQKCMTDPDSVKLMIKNKQLTLDDRNEWGNTILMVAAENGAYELVQFCLVHPLFIP